MTVREFHRILLSELPAYASQGWTPIRGESLPSGIDVVLIERVVDECHTGPAQVEKQDLEQGIEQ